MDGDDNLPPLTVGFVMELCGAVMTRMGDAKPLELSFALGPPFRGAKNGEIRFFPPFFFRAELKKKANSHTSKNTNGNHGLMTRW
jgi:hypothetical protein